MYINAISANYHNTQYIKKTKSNKPSFKGQDITIIPKEINSDKIKEILDMLKNKVTAIGICSGIAALMVIVVQLKEKYRDLPGAPGIVPIPDEELAKFVKKNIPNNILSKFMGFCVAYGNKEAQIDEWTDAQEAIVALVPKAALQPDPNPKPPVPTISIPLNNKYPS